MEAVISDEVIEPITSRELKGLPLDKRERALSRKLLASIIVNAILVLLIVIMVLIDKFRPVPVVVVDSKTGKIVGEYSTTVSRKDSELQGAVAEFTKCITTLNSDTVYQDWACALDMMSEPLREEKKLWLKGTNLIRQIYDARSESHTEIDLNEIQDCRQVRAKPNVQVEDLIDLIDAPSIAVENGNDKTTDLVNICVIEVSGRIVVNDIQTPFRYKLVTQVVPISSANTKGIRVLRIDEYEY